MSFIAGYRAHQHYNSDRDTEVKKLMDLFAFANSQTASRAILRISTKSRDPPPQGIDRSTGRAFALFHAHFIAV